MLKNAYWAWDGILDSDFCDYVLKKLDWETSEVGKIRDGEGIVDEQKRITNVIWQDIQSPITAVASHFTQIANERAEWNLDIKYPQRVQIGRYQEKGHYDWHFDITKPDEFNFQRKLSCSILLNDGSEYDGGDLEFKKVDEKLPRSKGSVIVFPSIIEHRVTPVTRGTRYSAVCWTVGPAFK